MARATLALVVCALAGTAQASTGYLGRCYYCDEENVLDLGVFMPQTQDSEVSYPSLTCGSAPRD